MATRTDSRNRALVLLVLASLVATLIGGRLVWWQVIEHDRLSAMAESQLAQDRSIPALRGIITDSAGRLLATSVQADSVFATPPTIEDPHHAALLLAGTLGLEVQDLTDRLSSQHAWVWLKRRVDPEVSVRVRALGITGVGILPETKRVYAMSGPAEGTTLAAQLLGYVNVDGLGQYGVEGASDTLLAGTPGQVVAQEDAAGRRIADSIFQLTEPLNGSNLSLTIDAGLQDILEREMWDTYQRNRAKGITGVILDVHTGAVLAMANFPSFDANAYSLTDPALFTNAAASREYEPGSVMKPLTVAAALDSGAITADQTFLDDNNLVIYDQVIHNADRDRFPDGHGPLTATDVLAFSNNVGAAKIALELGSDRLYSALRRFGFGTPTGVEIAPEASGQVWRPTDPQWTGDLTTAQYAFGQGLSVTAVQLAAAYAAIANGGNLVSPHVVAGWTDGDGLFHPRALPDGERVMREETANAVLDMLTNAVDNGIANAASISGYSIAGKTGTAQIAGPVKVRVRVGLDASGRGIYQDSIRYQYINGWIDSSFIGIAPASDPQVVMLITIHRPGVDSHNQVAEGPATAFSQLGRQVFEYLAIPPDRILTEVARP